MSPFETVRSFPPLIARYKNNNEQFYMFITGLSPTHLKLSQKAPGPRTNQLSITLPGRRRALGRTVLSLSPWFESRHTRALRLIVSSRCVTKGASAEMIQDGDETGNVTRAANCVE